MSETKFTPGPWRIDEYGSIVDSKDDIIAEEVLQSGDPGDYILPLEEQEANASLIAAAPQMLEALKRSQIVIDGYIALCVELGQTHIAAKVTKQLNSEVIAKAEGE